jgi:hypothetical protein
MSEYSLLFYKYAFLWYNIYKERNLKERSWRNMYSKIRKYIYRIFVLAILTLIYLKLTNFGDISILTVIGGMFHSLIETARTIVAIILIIIFFLIFVAFGVI